jgi:hypothetical protein
LDVFEELRAREEIKDLKARYWRAIDTQDAALLASVFTDDASIPFQGEQLTADEAPPPPRSGAEFVQLIMGLFKGARTAHHGHTPEITFQSDVEATGIWSQEDWIWAGPAAKVPFRRMHGWGRSYDTYRKTPDGWRIVTFNLVRTRLEME